MKKLLLPIFVVSLFACSKNKLHTNVEPSSNQKKTTITETINKPIGEKKLTSITLAGFQLYFKVIKQDNNFLIMYSEDIFNENRNYKSYILKPNAPETKQIYQELLNALNSPQRVSVEVDPEFPDRGAVYAEPIAVMNICTLDEKNCIEIEPLEDLLDFVWALPK